MAVLCGMSTIQYSARSARSYIIYCLSQFRHVAVLVCRRFDHTPTSSGHAHLDRRVTRERASDVAENLGRFLVRSIHAGRMTELIQTVKIETRHPV